MNKAFILFGLLATLCLTSCKNRLQPRLYQEVESKKLFLPEIDTYYKSGFVMGNDPDLSYMQTGRGTVMIVERQGPTESEIKIFRNIFSVNEKLSYKFIFDLPFELNVDSIPLAGKSICRLIGRYELEEKQRIYECVSGDIVIDTVWNTALRARVNGVYVNAADDSLKFSGDVKARRRD